MKAILTKITSVIGKIKSFFVKQYQKLEQFVESIVRRFNH